MLNRATVCAAPSLLDAVLRSPKIAPTLPLMIWLMANAALVSASAPVIFVKSAWISKLLREHHQIYNVGLFFNIGIFAELRGLPQGQSPLVRLFLEL